MIGRHHNYSIISKDQSANENACILFFIHHNTLSYNWHYHFLPSQKEKICSKIKFWLQPNINVWLVVLHRDLSRCRLLSPVMIKGHKDSQAFICSRCFPLRAVWFSFVEDFMIIVYLLYDGNSLRVVPFRLLHAAIESLYNSWLGVDLKQISFSSMDSI